MPILAQQHNWNLDSNKAFCFVQTEVGRLWAKINSVADDVDHLKQTVPKQASIAGLSCLYLGLGLVPVSKSCDACLCISASQCSCAYPVRHKVKL